VAFLLDSKVDHGGEYLPRIECVSFLVHEHSPGVWVFSCSKWVRVLKAVVPSQEKELWVVRAKVVSIEGGLHHPSPEPRNGVGVHWCEALDIAEPVVPWYDPRFFNNFRGWRMWAIVEIRGW
jgi:hypothetical protein